MKLKLCLSALIVLTAIASAPAAEKIDNQAINGDFEDTVVFPESHPYAKAMREGGWTLDTPILRPNGWAPHPVMKQGEFRLIRDKAQAHSGEICVFLKGDLAEEEHIAVKPGDKVTIQFWARAKDPGKVAGVFYVYGKDAQGKPGLAYDAFQFTEPASNVWTKYSHTFEVPDRLKECVVTTVVPVLRSFSGAFFDDVEVFANKVAQEDLVILQPDKTSKSQAAFNGGFEDWQTLSPVPADWDLNAGLFPGKWLVEKRPGEKGSLRRVVNSGEDRKRFGDYSLLLNGRIISEKEMDQVFNKDLQITFCARGAGGHIDLRVRLYTGPLNQKTEAACQLGRVIEMDTDGEWKEYTGTILAYGNSIYGARLELIGQGVVIDNLRVVISGKADADKKEVFQPIMTIPILKEGPKLAAGFSAEQWKGALEIRTGFMNMHTGNSVLRQTACSLATDGKKLFICAKCRVDGELKTTVQQRDGNVWEDDSVEVYINPFYDREKSPARIYQFVINANGAVYDHSVEVSIGQPPQPGWNCKDLEVKSQMINNDWVLMLAIPLGEVGLVPGKNWGLNICRNFQSPGEWTSLTGGAYQNWKRMVACCLAADAPAIAWGYTGSLTNGSLGAAATIGNLSSTPQTWQVSLDIAGEGRPDRKQVQTVNVAPAASQQVIVEGEDQKLDKGRVTIQVADAQGKVWFSEAIPFDRQEIKAAGKASAAAAQQQRWRLEYFPVQGKVNIRLLALGNRRDLQLGKQFGQTLVSIYKDGQLILEKTVAKPLIVDNEGHVTVPFAPKEDGVYFVRAMVADEKGDCIDFVSGSFEKQPTPWLGNTLGKESVIVPPFTPMKTRKQTISCWGRDYQLGPSGLPEAITANGEQALAAPMTFELEDEHGKQSGKMSGGKLLDRAEDRVTFQGQTRFTGMDVNVKGWAEYDGVMRYEVELLPKSELSVKSFALDVPVNDVKYMHAVNGMRIQMTIFAMTAPGSGEYRDANVPLWAPGHVYKSSFDPFTLYLPADDGVIWSSRGVSTPKVYGNFMPYIWIGNARFGMSWFADNDHGWSHAPDSTCLELIRKGAVTTLRVHFIAKPVKLTGPRNFVFGLLATPVKPRRTGGAVIQHPTMGFGMAFLERWSSVRFADYFLAKNLKQKWNQTSQSALIYIANDLFNANDPAMKSMKDEWARTPGSADNHMGLFPMKLYGPNPEDYDSRAVCAEASRVDYQVAGLDRCMREGALDGVYMDNSCPAACNNIQHLNCGYVREDGQLQAGYHIFETRDLIKRTATLAYKYHCNWPWWAIHMTSAMVIPCFTFADLCVDGEWGHEGKDFMDFFTLPYLEVFGAGAWGPNQGWLPKLHGLEKETKPTRTLLAALNLYDMWNWGAYCNADLVKKNTDIQKAFGIAEADCRFVGYWEKDAEAVAGLPIGVKSSFYVRPSKGALIYVTNFAKEPKSVDIQLDFAKFSISSGKIADAETGKEIELVNGKIKLGVEARDFRVIQVMNVKN